MAHRSITFQITLLFAAASTAVLLLLGFLIGASVEAHFEEQDMDVLNGKLQLVRKVLGDARGAADLDAVPAQLDDILYGHDGLALMVVAPDGALLYASVGAAFPSAMLEAPAAATPLPAPAPRPRTWTTADGQPLRGIVAPAATGIPQAPPARVALALDTSHHAHFMESFRTTLWSVVVVAALLTGFLGWAAARRGLAPLRAIRQGAAGVTAQRLDFRLETAAVPAELAELAETLNAMLTRLQDSFRRLSDFSSDLAHELRTPLSNLLTQTQVTLSKARTADEYRDILASNSEELERLARTVADMLFLAKSDNALIVPHREPVDLADEVEKLFEFYEALAEDKGIALACRGNARVAGDRLMLRRALNNLLSNAVRHTPPGGRIQVEIAVDRALDGASPATARIAVENTGATIPAEHLPRLFDRFYRADLSRHRFGEGAGLGLAITRSILRAHGGDAQVFSQNGVTRFELSLPDAPA
ncbi:MAG: two-component sensor histidine kinase [Candidatus Accumulibacter sp. 66-26]|nr:heavy metal sensor histidine kinase [Accumulibacter sp.]OJW47250.1 MAG: two-component sensor histidine kinase [Candidatus Accumulibacter sp. 66-26]